MGRDKVLLADKAGRTLLAHLQDELADFDEVLISSNEIEGAVPDIFPGLGPMAGIHAALKMSRNPLLFSLPCDMPLFPKEAVLRMLEAYPGGGCRALVCRDGRGRIHPVCCVVSKELILLLEEKLKNQFFREAGAEIADLPDFPDEVFLNMNTPEDYERYLRSG